MDDAFNTFPVYLIAFHAVEHFWSNAFEYRDKEFKKRLGKIRLEMALLLFKHIKRALCVIKTIKHNS